MSKSMVDIRSGMEQIEEQMQAIGVKPSARRAILRVVAKEAVAATMREPLPSSPPPAPRGLQRQAL